MTTARIFTVRNSQAVRLPVRFRFRSQDVEIFRNGDEVILREKLNGGRRSRQGPQRWRPSRTNSGPA
ncbi:MAG: AbrB/MazE/SpoVT family DNA-binding domain-containing protein [Xanthobacteraceae bacterium]|nr:AbrB/MazE/SpoVT family DNA-binding domain-containing protein [Xanthobacteraceae bacterium]